MMDACSDPAVREVVIMAGAQLGKSEVILNVIGYFIDIEPAPILCMQPTVDMAQSFSKDRVTNGLLKATPVLQGKVADAKSRDANNTTLHKIFPGGALSLTGANSPAGLASRPIRILLCDETDRYPMSAGNEGSPVHLGRKRTATFWNRKIIMVSTPTNKGASVIEDAYEKSDMRRYLVPCKHCNYFQLMKWSNVKWVDRDPHTAKYECEDCHVLWGESDRLWSIRHGKWEATAPFDGIAGFHISGLCSSWTPLVDGVRDFLSVKDNPEQLRVWINTYLGESYEDKGEQIDDYALAERREDFGGGIPEEVVFLTCGVDIQDNRIELQITGWSRDEEQYVIKMLTLYGDPSTPQLWTALDSHLFASYECNDGREIPIRASCIDSGGHFTNAVYSYCKKNAGRRVFAIKGVGGEGRALVGKPSKNNIGKCALFPVGVDTAKDLLFARLKNQNPGPGYIHFHHELSDEYFKQLTAEKVVTKFNKGFKRRGYVKTRSRNEALDCYVYSMAAYAILNVDINTLADRRERDAAQQPEAEIMQPPPKRRQFVPTPSQGFATNWR